MFAILIVIYIYLQLLRVIQKHYLILFHYLVYFNVVHRHYFLDFWSRYNLKLRFMYVIINIFCDALKIQSIFKASLKIDVFFFINLISFYFDEHIDFLVDVFELFVKFYHAIHIIIDWIFVLMNCIHIILNVTCETQRNLNDFIVNF